MTAAKPDTSSKADSSNTNKNDSKVDYKNLPLVPQAILKKRHQQDDEARLRAAAAALLRKGKRQYSESDGVKRQIIRIKRPETIIARARMRRNHDKRFRRVMRLGMMKRASSKPEFATKEIEMDEEEEETKDKEMKDAGGAAIQKKIVPVVKYQSNSVNAPMVFVVRLRDNIGCPKSVKQVLTDLQLTRKYYGVFLRYTNKNRKLLHLVEPWVVYGPPSRAAVVDLLERRGYGKKLVENDSAEKDKDTDETKKESNKGKSKKDTKKQDFREIRVPLSDNVVIEDALGKCCNILCKEDLVHELCSDKPSNHFDHVTNFLWPFLLHDDKTMKERKLLKVTDGKFYGDRGEAITDYIQSIL